MDEHAWCRSPSRDEAVRAAEDNRKGPLPTLEQAIATVTERRPPEPEGGGNVTGLRTELVTLEVTHRFADPIASVLLQAIDSVLSGQGESVFVMDGSCEITKLTDERAAAIRERDEHKARVDYLERDRKYWFFTSAFHERQANALRARVAELESAAKLAPAANADGGGASGCFRRYPHPRPARPDEYRPHTE